MEIVGSSGEQVLTKAHGIAEDGEGGLGVKVEAGLAVAMEEISDKEDADFREALRTLYRQSFNSDPVNVAVYYEDA